MQKFLVRKLSSLFLLIFIVSSVMATNEPQMPVLKNKDVTVEMTNVVVKNIDIDIKLHFNNEEFRQVMEGLPVTIYINNEVNVTRVVKGVAHLKYKFDRKQELEIKVSEYAYKNLSILSLFGFPLFRRL